MLLVVGSARLEIVLGVDRLPATNETMLAGAACVEPGGKGLIQAVVARRAGAPVRLVAPVGDDAAGRVLREAVAAEGLALEDLVTVAGASDVVVTTVAADGERTVAIRANVARGAKPPACLDRLGAGDAVLVQGELPLDVARACLEAARARGARTFANLSPVAFDMRPFLGPADARKLGGRAFLHAAPGPDEWEPLLPLVDVGILSTGEALFLGSARGLLGEGVGAVVVSRGAIGAELLAPDRRLQVGAPRGEVADELGTDETLCGVLVALLLEGLTIEAALPRAVQAAAIAATRPGCWGALPSAAELAALGG